MSIYEILGRIIILHESCEDLFASCGNNVDRLKNLISDNDEDIDAQTAILNDILVKLNEIDTELSDYKSLVIASISSRIVDKNKLE